LLVQKHENCGSQNETSRAGRESRESIR